MGLNFRRNEYKKYLYSIKTGLMEKNVLNNNQDIIKKLSNKNSIKILIVLIIGAFFIRVYFTPFNIPISLDGIDYFAYAIAMSREGVFPTGYLQTNFGWSSFVSVFFMFNQDADMLTLMNLQRILSIIISISTTIPIYFLTKIFFKKEISLLVTTLFLFDPRIIENSILGITDTLFILLTVLIMLFIFYKKGSWIYLSFICTALAAFVRYEGLLLIIPLIISYILKNKQVNFSKLKLIIGISLFLIIIIIINFINYENTGQTSVFTQLIWRGNYISETVITNESNVGNEFLGSTVENKLLIFTENAIEGFVKYTAWILIPIFIIFCILGTIFIPKTITKNKIIFGIFFVFLSLSSIFAYGREIQETRYVLVLLPIFALLSGYGFNYLMKYGFKKIILITVVAVVISSFIFTEYKSQDKQYESEMYDATLFLTNEAEGVNNYHSNKYVKVADLQNNWPELLPKGENGKMDLVTKKFKIEGFERPSEYIEFNKNKGLTHLLIKEGDKNGFFDDVFHNENKYPLLEKIVDSKDLGIKTKYKIFKINNEE